MSGAERKGLESLETMPVAVEAPLFPSGVEAGSRGSDAERRHAQDVSRRAAELHGAEIDRRRRSAGNEQCSGGE